MFGIGYQELVIIFLIILLLFGAKKLPEIGRSMGRTLAEFRKGMKEAEKAFREEGEKGEPGGEAGEPSAAVTKADNRKDEAPGPARAGEDDPYGHGVKPDNDA